MNLIKPIVNSTRSLPSLDGIRAFSIIIVIGSHFEHSFSISPATLPLLRSFFNGPLGVNIFFVLSGFLITYLLMEEEAKSGTISLKNFYIRRVFRIFPVYYAFLLVLFLIQLFSHIDFTNCQWLTSLTFTKNFGCKQWLDGHLWSLSVEEQFYLIWPLILVLVIKNKNRFLIALLLIIPAALFRVLLNRYGYWYLGSYSIVTNADSLMIGSVAGILFQKKSTGFLNIIKYKPYLFRCLAVLLMFFVTYLSANHIATQIVIPFGRMMQSLAAAYLISSYVYLPMGFVYKLLNYKVVAYVGVLSYSLYLWQQLFFEKTFSPYLTSFPNNILFMFLAAFLSYNLLEKPFLKLRVRFMQNRNH